MARSYYSTVFEHDAAAVWAVARDFNGLATWWSEACSESHIEDGKSADQVGAVRSFVLGGGTIRERLLALSDLERFYSYEFVGTPPFPVTDYIATLRVTPVSDGRSFLEYTASFESDENERWTAFFPAEVFEPALNSLAAHLSR
ncbi:SRPBCC family protein [Cryptosporangium sp. NPDC048952]|uniref:SRPBCC family protein n=1 Tax=Cryptosporangium sp. NPDC048952 TaxID=3363961 RepID=UPI0037187124